MDFGFRTTTGVSAVSPALYLAYPYRTGTPFSTAADTAVRKYDAFFAPAYNDFVRVCIRSSINTSFDTYLPFRRLLGLIILPGHCPAGVRSQETDNSPLLQYLPIAWAPYGPSRLSLMKMALY